MSEKFEQQPPSSESWKKRGTKEKPYRARRISHEANTSIEYGEKTWTTAQTVRDLMQNHLDAETERYYQQIAKTIFDEESLKRYFDPNSAENDRKKAEELLHSAFTFAEYVEDMTPESRLQSEAHLQKLAEGLSVNSALQNENVFSSSLFLEAARPIEEERPSVYYEIVDGETHTTEWVAYETLRDEPLYQQKSKAGFRYQIIGMKIADHGSGFDSQLSALYLTSKTGKRHLRGKFGEGAKMSELHLLRNGASMKMRSRYSVKSGDAIEQSRVWQARLRVKDDRLVSRGVEVEQESNEDTGSMVSISLRGANETFQKDFIENADPRLKGLEKNIADYSSQGFSYPMPITEKHLSGVDTSGDGDVQYVQGIRVELAKESFGYQKPWFSYNFLDSSIIGGRDRNEIKGEITNRIHLFWQHVDSPELFGQLVRTAVHDKSKGGEIFSSSESLVLNEILTKDTSKSFPTENIQKIVDDALLRELALEQNVHTLVMTARDLRDPKLADVISYAREQGYEIKTTATYMGISAIECLAKRIADNYKVVTFVDIRNEMQSAPKEDEEEMVEGEREKAIREAFLPAVKSINEIVRAVGLEPKNFELEFDIPKKVNVGRERPDWEDNDDEDDYSNSIFQMHSRVDLPPITLTWTGDKDYLVQINPDRISYLGHSDPRALQREIEIYLLGSFTEYGDGGSDRESVLKRSQQFLDTIIEKLIPEDAPILEAIPKQLEYEKDPAVLLRLTKSILGEIETKHEKEKVVYEAYRKVLDTHLTSDEAQELYRNLRDSEYYNVKRILESRVFLNDGALVYYSAQKRSWERQNLEKRNPITKWRGLPAYALNDGRYFISAPMPKGAVLSKDEGKKREYTFSEGDNFLHIGSYGVEFEKYGGRYGEDVIVHPDGLILTRVGGFDDTTQDKHIQKQLDEYNYYPLGTSKREGNIDRRISSTAIPIEYGQDEWDNPVRIFQDVIQNHIDASPEGQIVRLTYEVDRNGNHVMADESDLLPTDKITGLTMQDHGSGYYPNDIATMGSSSKKSPLFAGKYGEGQKMVAAAALRNGLEIEYKSTVQNSSGMQSWNAQAISEARSVVLDGKEVEKNWLLLMLSLFLVRLKLVLKLHFACHPKCHQSLKNSGESGFRLLIPGKRMLMVMEDWLVMYVNYDNRVLSVFIL